MTTKNQIYGLVERNLSRANYIGKIIGFPHIEFEGSTLEDVIAKLQAHAAQLANSGSLVQESEFIGVVRL